MREFAPHLVGVTSMYSNSLQAEALVRTTKRIDPDTMTVAGGSHFGALGSQSLRRIPELDYVIEGESETALIALLNGHPPKEIPRLHYRLDDECANNASSGLMDLAELVHDLLTISRTFLTAFCDAMLDSRLPVEWMANSRTDSRLDGLLPKMKAAGCWKLFHGVESASPQVQKAIDKRLDIDQVYECIEKLHAHGIAATTSFVIGFPTESCAELSSTIAMGARLKLMGVETVQFHRLRRFPPAPLSRVEAGATFDLESLRIEYPPTSLPATG